ncbi:hypothetical protein Baya_14631 [Bagarius yarrelli]|uniref:Uncharacterized protein n=1 Tax=Bagarius yarrelli TaxID=175774 RepID=A0A556V9B1_BAGYA|nr:hypothetical protein Baya_14631 [Bagarius yarrelli]
MEMALKPLERQIIRLEMIDLIETETPPEFIHTSVSLPPQQIILQLHVSEQRLSRVGGKRRRTSKQPLSKPKSPGPALICLKSLSVFKWCACVFVGDEPAVRRISTRTAATGRFPFSGRIQIHKADFFPCKFDFCPPLNHQTLQSPDDELQHKPNCKPVQVKDRGRAGRFVMPSSEGDIRIAGVLRCYAALLQSEALT